MKNENVYATLNISEKARWIALLMAIDHIDAHCKEKDQVFDDVVCLKPIPIKHFIEEKHKQIQHALQLDDDRIHQRSLMKSFKTNLLTKVMKSSPSSISHELFAKA